MSKDEIKTAERIRTITWDDPKINAINAQSVSGLDYLLGIKTGKISPPPMARLVGYKILEIEHGHAVYELDPGEYHLNPFATVHGGTASTLLDTTMTAAVLSTLSRGFSCSTLEIKINFIRPIIIKTGKVTCDAEVIHLGSRIAAAKGRINDFRGKLHVHGIGTCIIFQTDKD